MNQPLKPISIDWRDWSQEAFATADREGKPVLLALTATWCHWCHVMDDTSYANPRVIDLVNSRFVPVSVDVDRRPDISRRYNQGGFPSVAILNSQGKLIAGRTYIPPDQMVDFLEQIAAGGSKLLLAAAVDHPEAKDSAVPASKPGGLDQSTPPEAPGQSTPFNRVLQKLEQLYDAEFGGFGQEPKQPPWEALRLLLALHSRSGNKHLLAMVCKTLDSMLTGLYDQKDQGFFRYSVSRDWMVPHYEKMAVTNAQLAVLYVEAYQLTGRVKYREAAAGAFKYLLGTLYDPKRKAFFASQDAWEDYYRLPWKNREESAKPPVDTTVYSGWNALAAGALVKAFGVFGKPYYLEVASGVLDRLWDDAWVPERGMRHVLPGPMEQPVVLEDHVYFVRALLELHQSTGQREHLRRAIEVAEHVRNLFGASDGGFYDTAQSLNTADDVLLREKPVLENSLLAEALVGLSYLTGDSSYQDLAGSALKAFEEAVPGTSYLGIGGYQTSEASQRMEEDEERLFLPAGSAWARAWDLFSCGPVHLVVVGGPSQPETKRLTRASLKQYVPHRVAQLLDPQQDRGRVTELGFPLTNKPALYICMGNICLAPITNPGDARGVLKSRPWATG